MTIKDLQEEKKICEDIIRALDKPRRLIDADVAYKVLTDYYHQRTKIQREALKEAIERVPTVEAVRHGHWEEFVCSVCGKIGWDNEDNYCPNCGAKMDEAI